MKPVLLFAMICCAAFGIAAFAAENDGLEPGKPAPPFSLPGSDGKTYALDDLRGKTVVIAWFPKAFTGG